MELEDLMQFGKRCLALLSDEAFDSLMYFLKTRKRLNLVDPQTYTEKLLYIKSCLLYTSDAADEL